MIEKSSSLKSSRDCMNMERRSLKDIGWDDTSWLNQSSERHTHDISLQCQRACRGESSKMC